MSKALANYMLMNVILFNTLHPFAVKSIFSSTKMPNPETAARWQFLCTSMIKIHTPNPWMMLGIFTLEPFWFQIHYRHVLHT